MKENWLLSIIIGVVAFLLYLLCDKLQILKSKPWRIFAAIIVSSVICWVVYELAIAA